MRREFIGKIFKVKKEQIYLFRKYINTNGIDPNDFTDEIVYMKIKDVGCFSFYYENLSYYKIKNKKIINFENVLRLNKLKKLL